MLRKIKSTAQIKIESIYWKVAASAFSLGNLTEAAVPNN